jgi:meso-butanediol dehydrogenase / (S,S)-butanediol dehydrogenase / diacetyl reductase
MRLAGKGAIVTGGGSGIGRAAAERFACEGAKVVVADYHAANGQETVHAIGSSGGEASFIQLDVTDWAQVQGMVEQTLATYQTVDILLNCAGIFMNGTALDMSEQDWQRVIGINLTGTFWCCKAVLPPMIARGSGSIINMTSSVGAHAAIGNAAAYVASKGGVTLLTRALAIDHAREGVRVNAIAPGPTDTPMIRDGFGSSEEIETFAAQFPFGRLGRPEEIAAAALFLASDEASFVTGAVLAADGGQTAGV